jgi:ubiquinone/menaquinone biosynthesis C-methylase UbiE
MSYYTEKQFVKSGKDTEKTSVLFNTYFSNVKEKILEAGCSTGNFLLLNPKKIQGIDFDKESIEICKQKGLNAKVMDVTLKLKFKNESFNAIFCSYLIEHIQNPLFMLKEFKRILKRNGKLVLITNDWVRTHDKINSNFYDDYTHKTPFTKASLERIAFDSGFRNFFVEYQPKSITGLGWLIRKQFLTVKQVMFFQKVMRFFGVTNNGIVLIAYKKKGNK